MQSEPAKLIQPASILAVSGACLPERKCKKKCEEQFYIEAKYRSYIRGKCTTAVETGATAVKY